MFCSRPSFGTNWVAERPCVSPQYTSIRSLRLRSQKLQYVVCGLFPNIPYPTAMSLLCLALGKVNSNSPAECEWSVSPFSLGQNHPQKSDVPQNIDIDILARSFETWHLPFWGWIKMPSFRWMSLLSLPFENVNGNSHASKQPARS